MIIWGKREILLGRIEFVVLIDSHRNIPSAAESFGDDHEIARTEFDAFGGTLGVGLHLPFDQITCLLGVKLERELSWGTTPPSENV